MKRKWGRVPFRQDRSKSLPGANWARDTQSGKAREKPPQMALFASKRCLAHIFPEKRFPIFESCQSMVPPEDNADRAEEKSQSQRHEEPSAIQALRDACVIATGREEEWVATVYDRFMQAVDSFTASLRQKEDEFARLSRITEQVNYGSCWRKCSNFFTRS